MSTPAIFLSYAREDAACARRIAEALRAAGLEVWFDENELRGGDAWDAKIRQQIDACALFIPIVSQHTQARGKGYFRLEWKLAVEQTHLMAEGIAYLAPVVIDDTPESGAIVPPEFLKVQWTRLPGALPTPQFVEQVRRLLTAPRAGSGTVPRSAATALASGSGAEAAPLRTKSPLPKIVAALVALAAIAGVLFFALEPTPQVTSARATETKSTAQPPAAPAPSSAAPAASDKSIAVLPFVNMSGDKDSEYFSDGLTEEVLNALARNPGLRVAARTSSFAFKGKNVAIDEIGRALRAASVIEGSVRKDGSRIRITVQLINAADGYHVWSETFTREMTDIFAVQDEIANKVAQKLGGAAAGSGSVAAAAVPTQNLAAYDLYLRARSSHHSGGNEFTLETAKLYEQVVQLDPDYALAWARLADVCADIYGRGLDRSSEMARKARSAAAAALRLAPNLPETRLAMARVAQNVDRDLEAARSELDAVERLQPNAAELPAARVRLAHADGQWGASLASLIKRAVEADPQNAAMLNAMAMILTDIGRWTEADLLYDRAMAAGVGAEVAIRGKVANLLAWTGDNVAGLALLETTPEKARATSRFYYQRANRYWQLGDFDRAVADFERYRASVLQHYPNRSGPRGLAVSCSLAMGQIELQRGDRTRAGELFGAALGELDAYEKEFPEVDMTSTRALILAHRGQAQDVSVVMEEGRRRVLETRDVSAIMSRHRGRAAILAILGRPDEAIAELQIVHRSGYAFGYNLRRSTDFKSLHGDPRFQELMAEAEARADAQPRPKK